MVIDSLLTRVGFSTAAIAFWAACSGGATPGNGSSSSAGDDSSAGGATGVGGGAGTTDVAGGGSDITTTTTTGGAGTTTTGGAGTTTAGAGGTGNGGGASDSGAAGGGVDGGGVGSGFPAHLAAPYVETYNKYSLSDLVTKTGHKYYTLAFVISKGCVPMWNGDTPVTGNANVTEIANLRKLGGDVIISFGGEGGTKLGDACTTVESLQAAYEAVITKYDLRWMDLDIESGAESRTASIDRRNKAVKNLQDAHPGLKVSYTLAVEPNGLGRAQQSLLTNAKTNGVHVDVVNVMTMDYGVCNVDMGKTAIGSADAAHKQLQTLGLDAAIGVTPMSGVNDDACEDFTSANATSLVAYAESSGFVGLLAFWAVAEDPNLAYLNIFKTFH